MAAAIYLYLDGCIIVVFTSVTIFSTQISAQNVRDACLCCSYFLKHTVLGVKSKNSAPFSHFLVTFQGRIQHFLKEGAPTLRVYRTFGAGGDRGCLRGMCPLRSEEKLQFSKSIRTIWCILFARGHPHKVRHYIAAKNRGGARRVRPPLNPPLLLIEGKWKNK